MNLQAFDKVLAQENLSLSFSPEWIDSGAIRKAMQTNSSLLELIGGIERINLEKSPPVVSGGGGLSISHSKLGGLILTSKSHLKIGIDLEEVSRLSDKVINRVSSEQERKNSPNPIFLWPAKEASFKSLYPDNEDIIIPQLIIQKWEEVAPRIWSFSTQHGQKSIKGFLLSSEFLLVGAAITRL